jgi:hypothetical protein
VATLNPSGDGTVKVSEIRKLFMENISRYHNVNQAVLDILGHSLLDLRWRVREDPHDWCKVFEVSIKCRAPDGGLVVDVVNRLTLQDTLGEQQSYALEKCMHDAICGVAASDVHIPKLCLVWADYILEAEKNHPEKFIPEEWSLKVAGAYRKSLYGK